MIISDRYKFVFIHIPKCAGTTVKEYLKEFDNTKGEFIWGVANHPNLGMIDYAHIPLKVLKNYFPNEYDKIEKYWSFSIVRNPFSRFKSSLAQRVRGFKKRHLYQMSIKEIQKEIDEVIKFLSNYEKFYLPYDYIHFQRQVDYIFLENRQIVKDIYDLNNIGKLLEKLENILKKPYPNEKLNKTKYYRNNVVRVVFETSIKLLSPIKEYIPDNIKKYTHSMVFVDNNKKIDKLFETKYVKNFVNEYYKEDIKLYYSDKIIR